MQNLTPTLPHHIALPSHKSLAVLAAVGALIAGGAVASVTLIDDDGAVRTSAPSSSVAPVPERVTDVGSVALPRTSAPVPERVTDAATSVGIQRSSAPVPERVTDVGSAALPRTSAPVPERVTDTQGSESGAVTLRRSGLRLP